MKRLIIIFISVSVVVACNKTSNTSFTPSCGTATVSYSATVNNLISSNCASSGCHSAGSRNGPGELITYEEISSNSSRIRSAIIDGIMPKGSTINSVQKNSIVCWIDAGAPNN